MNRLSRILPTFFALLLSTALLVPVSGFAIGGTSDDNGNHTEFTFGFLGGQRDYTASNFAYSEGAGNQGLAEPFERAPFNALSVVGLRWEGRVVLNYVRMTVGYDMPFSNFSASAAKHTYQVNGETVEVMPQSVSPRELRFGLGGEYPLSWGTPYADLMGAMSWSDAELSANGKKVVYSARSFSFAARAGVRFYVRSFFFLTTSAEVGFFGNLRWNAELSAGFHLG